MRPSRTSRIASGVVLGLVLLSVVNLSIDKPTQVSMAFAENISTDANGAIDALSPGGSKNVDEVAALDAMESWLAADSAELLKAMPAGIDRVQPETRRLAEVSNGSLVVREWSGDWNAVPRQTVSVTFSVTGDPEAQANTQFPTCAPRPSDVDRVDVGRVYECEFMNPMTTDAHSMAVVLDSSGVLVSVLGTNVDQAALSTVAKLAVQGIHDKLNDSTVGDGLS